MQAIEDHSALFSLANAQQKEAAETKMRMSKIQTMYIQARSIDIQPTWRATRFLGSERGSEHHYNKIDTSGPAINRA